MDRDKILLTPGPLTTSKRTRLAMLRDWGSWDADFNALTAELRYRLLELVHGQEAYTAVPLQGSGTFSVEAAVATIVPRDGHLLVLDNGAYCKRMALLARTMGRKTSVLTQPENLPVDVDALREKLLENPGITHVGLVHCETVTGILNPLQAVSDLCRQLGRGLIVDAMSSFGALPIDCRTLVFDALVSASGKCLEGVPGMGFAILRKSVLELCRGNSHSLSLDLYDQLAYMEHTGQWRYTPPTHVAAALAEALRQLQEEGGQPARLARYQANFQCLLNGMGALGIRPYLQVEHMAPIIATFLAPRFEGYDFKAFYNRVKAHGFLIYPGKLTEVETFRVGCIGDIGVREMQHAVDAIAHALRDLPRTSQSDIQGRIGSLPRGIPNIRENCRPRTCDKQAEPVGKLKPMVVEAAQ